MYWTNYHNHCHYDDGKEAINNHVKTAIRHGVKSLGFSCHCPVPFKNLWSMKMEDTANYLTEIDIASHDFNNQIQLYKSMEIDFIPGMISPKSEWIKALKLDYTLGSVHFVGSYDDGRPWEIDGRHSVFLDGLDKIYNGDIEFIVGRYFELIRQMIRESQPDIVGHMDKIKIQNQDLWNENAIWYKKEVMNTLEEIKAAESIIEVNTRGIYKKLTNEAYPSQWILEQIYDMEIPIHINSDAHLPREIIQSFKATSMHLRQIGFNQLKVLMNHEWQFVYFEDNGLKWHN